MTFKYLVYANLELMTSYLYTWLLLSIQNKNSTLNFTLIWNDLKLSKCKIVILLFFTWFIKSWVWRLHEPWLHSRMIRVWWGWRWFRWRMAWGGRYDTCWSVEAKIRAGAMRHVTVTRGHVWHVARWKGVVTWILSKNRDMRLKLKLCVSI